MEIGKVVKEHEIKPSTFPLPMPVPHPMPVPAVPEPQRREPKEPLVPA
jgi:hypothetical protein